MNRTEILSQKSATHIAATADNHKTGVFRTAVGYQWNCECGQNGPENMTFDLADYGSIQHKRGVR